MPQMPWQYSLGVPISDMELHLLARGGYILGVYTLGVYTLGIYSLAGSTISTCTYYDHNTCSENLFSGGKSIFRDFRASDRSTALSPISFLA